MDSSRNANSLNGNSFYLNRSFVSLNFYRLLKMFLYDADNVGSFYFLAFWKWKFCSIIIIIVVIINARYSIY